MNTTAREKMERFPALAGEWGFLLRIYIGSRDRHDGAPLYEVILQQARKSGMAGATVLEGFMGFGANSIVHHANLWRLSEDLPVIIELIDETAKIEAFLPAVQTLLSGGGLITLQTVRVLHYQPHPAVDGENA